MSKKIFSLSILLLVLIISCNSSTSESTVKFKQYYLKGENLYKINCSNCHQKSGSGLGLLYPPLDRSDFLIKNRKEVICLIRYGKSGELLVNNKSYNHVMPAFPDLTDIEIAEITTFIYNSWSNKEGLIDVKDVNAILSDCQ
jgi:cytochrome c551